MGKDVYIPQLGQTVEQVTIVTWHAVDGAQVEKGQEILEVETDKAVFPIEAAASGFIHHGPFGEGTVVPVLTVIATIGSKDEVFQAPTAANEVNAEPETPAQDLDDPLMSKEILPAKDLSKGKIFVSPRARRAAREASLDLSQVQASGEGGVRIVEKDVLKALHEKPKATVVAQHMAEAAGLDLATVAGSGLHGTVTKQDVEQALSSRPAGFVPADSGSRPLSQYPQLQGVRRIIAERMSASVRETARVTLFMEADATQLVEWRTKLKEMVSQSWGYTPGYNEILIKIAAAALKKYPYMNAKLTEAGNLENPEVNIGLAVDTDRGLLVPVIKQADQKTIREIGADIRQLADKARNARILPDDLSGGTFTITNLGMYDVDGFTPVINLPEAAILGIGRIAAKPVYVGEELMRRSMMQLSLVFDHRIVDGAPAARFLQYIKELIETPALLVD